MKKKILFGLLVSCLLCGGACALPNNSSSNNSASTLDPEAIPQTGLYTDIPKDTSVEIGNFFSYAQAAIAVDGKVYEPTVSVTLNGEAVETGDGYFSVSEIGEYTVSYKFIAGEKEYEYITKITGVDTTAPTIMIESGEIQYKYRIGDTANLPTFKSLDLSGEPSEPVTTVKTADGETVTITNGSFTVSSYDGYTISVTSEDESGNVGENVYDIAVYQESELEYFNSQNFIMESFKVMHGGVISYTDAESKILEGDGALVFSSTGKWPQVHLTDTANFDYTNVERLSFWIYNDTQFSYMIDCSTINDDYDINGTTAYFLYHQTLAPQAWTQISVTGEAFKTAYQTSIEKGTMDKAHICIGLNGSDNPNYLDFKLILDCFRIEYVGETHARIFTPNSIDCATSSEAGAKVQIAKADEILQNLTADKVRVTATVNGKNVTVEYDETEKAWYLPTATEGIYTVRYFCGAEEKSVGSTQTVTMLPAFKNGDFENEESNANNMKRISITSGEAELSIEEVTLDGRTTNALKASNVNSDPYVTFNLGREYFEKMTGYQTLTFKIAFVPNTCLDSTTGYILTAWDKQGGNNLFYYNTILRGELRHSSWFEFRLSQADLELVKETGMITFRLWIVGATEKGYDLYIDDVGVSDSTFDGSLSTTYELLDDFFGAYYGDASAKWLEINNVPEGCDKAIRVMTSKAGNNPLLTFKLGDEFVNSISVGDTFSFRVYVDKGNSSAINIKLHMGTKYATYDILPLDNIVKANTWVTYSVVITREILENYRSEGLLYVGFNAEGADVSVGDGRSMNYYFDDFQISKNS